MIKSEEYANKYASGILGFSADPYEKTEEEFRARMEYYYGMYSHGDCVFGHGGTKYQGTDMEIDFKTIRDQMRGMQDVNRYRDELDPITGKGKNKGRKWNISWRTDKRLSKHRDRLKTKFDGVRIDPIITATDESSVKAKQFIVGKMKFMADPRTKAFTQKIGRPVEDTGMTPPDVDIYADMGGIALPAEVAMKDAIDDALVRSDWELIRTMLDEDYIDIGARVFHIFQSDSKIRIEYVDPARYFRRYSEYPDGRDSDFKAFIKTRKISEIRQHISGENIEQKIEQIAQQYQGVNGADRFAKAGLRQDYDRSGGRASTLYDDVSVEVMTCYFVDTMLESYAVGQHKRGAKVFERVSPDINFEPRHKRELKQFPVHYLFKCDWVVGSDIVFNYGIADTIVREGMDGSKEVVFPIQDYILQEPSLGERCIGFDDDIQIATFKGRNMIAEMIPGPGMIVNKSALRSSVTFGDEKMSMKENIIGLRTTGYLFVEEKDGYASLPGTGDDRKRNSIFTPIVDQSLDKAAALDHRIEVAERGIMSVLGTSPLEDGNVNPEMLKHVAQATTAGTNSAIAPHIKIAVDQFRGLCKVICQKYRLMVLAGDVSLETKKDTILTRDLFKMDWSVKVLVDTLETKEVLMQDLLSKREMIPDEAFYQVYAAIKDGDLKRAQILLAKFSAKSKEQEHQRQMEIQQAVSRGNAEAAIAQEQASMKRSELEHELEIKLQEFKSGLEEEQKKRDHTRDLEKIREQAKFNYQKDTTIANIQKPVRQ